jgi:hypothetical protein
MQLQLAISSLQIKTAVELRLEEKKFVFLFFAKLLFAPSKTKSVIDKFRVNPRGITSLKTSNTYCNIAHNKRAIKSVLVLLSSHDLKKIENSENKSSQKIYRDPPPLSIPLSVQQS